MTARDLSAALDHRAWSTFYRHNAVIARSLGYSRRAASYLRRARLHRTAYYLTLHSIMEA